jgi:hypothetical protein
VTPVASPPPADSPIQILCWFYEVHQYNSQLVLHHHEQLENYALGLTCIQKNKLLN